MRGCRRARAMPASPFIRPSASREVILRLAVKDLVEQSQIAGAGQIEISFHEFGDVTRRRRTEHPLRHSCASRAVPWRRSRRRLAAVGGVTGDGHNSVLFLSSSIQKFPAKTRSGRHACTADRARAADQAAELYALAQARARRSPILGVLRRFTNKRSPEPCAIATGVIGA